VEQVAIAIPPRPEGVREMKGAGEESYRYTEAGCRKLEGEYRDICYQQLARQRAATDLEGGLTACQAVAERDTRMECTADVAELYASHDREAALEVCPTIPRKKWADQCVFGIALALSTTDPDWAFRICDQAGMWRDFCRHDVNGEISVIDDEQARTNCAREEGDLLTRKTCWHGIGKYIARVDVDQAFSACEKVPPGPRNLYRENCFHGLGWGAAETAGADFASACRRAGDQTESCKLGVAYLLRRLEPERALSICSSVTRRDLQERCNVYVRTGRVP
jgi:hypothetical protein